MYSQSEIDNATRLDQRIEQMSENVNYRMYLDAFGRIRAYEPVDGNRYALITEMYYGNYRNNRYVLNDVLTAEMKAGDEGITERVVNNPYDNNFLLDIVDITANQRDNWFDLNTVMENLCINGTASNYVEDLYQDIVTQANWNDVVHAANPADWAKNVVLQPATAHLGFAADQSRYAKDIFRNATTNIARYVVNTDGTVTLSTAAQKSYNANGTLAGGFSTDYVQLTSSSVRKGQNVFPATVDTASYNSNVNAVNETEFYIVSNNGVEHFVGYSNLPAISNIRAMYAVARNNSTDKDNLKYWIADVIVIEADNYSAQPDDYLFVLGRADYVGTLSNSRQAVGTQNVLAISAKQGGAIRITPTSYNWGSNTVKPGIYKAYGVAEVESGLYSVATLREVDPRQVNNALNPESVNTSGFNLRAGVVTKLWGLNDRISVEMTSPNGIVERTINLQGQALSVIQDGSGFISVGSRMNGDYWSNLVNNKHQIIWVEDNNSNALFTIDVTYSVDKSAKGSSMAALLTSIYLNVSLSQQDVTAAGDHTVTIKYVDDKHEIADVKRLVNNGAELRLNDTNGLLAPAGFAKDDNKTITYTNACYVVTNDVDNYGFVVRNITADVTVTVPVTAKEFGVTLKGTWSNKINVTRVHKADGDSDDLDLANNATAHVGDVITVKLSTDNVINGANFDLEVTDSNGDEVLVTRTNASTNEFKFTMPASAVVLAPSYEANKYDVKWENDAGVNHSTEKATVDQDYTFNATAKPGYVLTGITYTGNGWNGTPRPGANNSYTINADAVAANLTVRFTTEYAEASVILKTENGAPAVTYNGNQVTTSGTTVKDVNVTSTLRLVVSDNVGSFKVETNGCEYYTEKSGDTTYIVITNITQIGATVTVKPV